MHAQFGPTKHKNSPADHPHIIAGCGHHSTSSRLTSEGARSPFTLPSTPMDRSSKIISSIVLCLVLSAASAWLITTHLAPAPGSFVVVLLCCVVVAAVIAVVLSIL